jgi:hypothetical protein
MTRRAASEYRQPKRRTVKSYVVEYAHHPTLEVRAYEATYTATRKPRGCRHITHIGKTRRRAGLEVFLRPAALEAIRRLPVGIYATARARGTWVALYRWDPFGVAYPKVSDVEPHLEALSRLYPPSLVGANPSPSEDPSQ